MGFGGGPKAPSLTMPPPSAHPPTLGSAQVTEAAGIAKQKAAAAEGLGEDNTVATSPQGLQGKASTAPATLLGQ